VIAKPLIAEDSTFGGNTLRAGSMYGSFIRLSVPVYPGASVDVIVAVPDPLGGSDPTETAQCGTSGDTTAHLCLAAARSASCGNRRATSRVYLHADVAATQDDRRSLRRLLRPWRTSTAGCLSRGMAGPGRRA